MKSLSTTIQMKATWQYFSVVLLTVLFNVVLTFFNLSVEKTLNVKCDDSNEGYAVLSFLHSIQCKYNEYSSLSN